MYIIVAKRRISTALTGDIPTAAGLTHKIGEYVLVFVGKEKRWIRPLIVVVAPGRMVIVQSSYCTKHETLNAFQIKTFFTRAPEG